MGKIHLAGIKLALFFFVVGSLTSVWAVGPSQGKDPSEILTIREKDFLFSKSEVLRISQSAAASVEEQYENIHTLGALFGSKGTTKLSSVERQVAKKTFFRVKKEDSTLVIKVGDESLKISIKTIEMSPIDYSFDRWVLEVNGEQFVVSGRDGGRRMVSEDFAKKVFKNLRRTNSKYGLLFGSDVFAAGVVSEGLAMLTQKLDEVVGAYLDSAAKGMGRTFRSIADSVGLGAEAAWACANGDKIKKFMDMPANALKKADAAVDAAIAKGVDAARSALDTVGKTASERVQTEVDAALRQAGIDPDEKVGAVRDAAGAALEEKRKEVTERAVKAAEAKVKEIKANVTYGARSTVEGAVVAKLLPAKEAILKAAAAHPGISAALIVGSVIYGRRDVIGASFCDKAGVEHTGVGKVYIPPHLQRGPVKGAK